VGVDILWVEDERYDSVMEFALGTVVPAFPGPRLNDRMKKYYLRQIEGLGGWADDFKIEYDKTEFDRLFTEGPTVVWV
jgi:hypothetical protein